MYDAGAGMHGASAYVYAVGAGMYGGVVDMHGADLDLQKCDGL